MDQSTKTALYLRRGTQVWPGIMALEAGRLSFKTASETLFDTELKNFKATFTLFSTLVITVDTKKFVFVTGSYAGALAPSFTEAQVAELNEAKGVNGSLKKYRSGVIVFVGSNVMSNAMSLAGSVLGRGLGIIGQAAGVVAMFQAQREAFYSSKAWVLYLQKQGLSVTMRGSTFALSQAVICAIGIPAILLLVAGVYGLVWALSR